MRQQTSSADRSLLRDLGHRLARLRQARGLTQAELASRLGLEAAESVSRVERGGQNPGYTTLLRWAGAFGVHPAELFPTVEPFDDGNARAAVIDGLVRDLEAISRECPTAIAVLASAIRGVRNSE